MLAIIFTVIFTMLVAFFAIQNTASVMINIPQYSWPVPLYLVVLLSILVGFVFAWILHLMNAFASFFVLRGKDNAIKKGKKVNAELANKIHNLEIEKAKLETEKKSQSSNKWLPWKN